MQSPLRGARGCVRGNFGKLCVGLAAIAAAFSAPGSASAATLTAVKGDVLISHGAGFKSVKGTTDLRDGDMVMTTSNGSASLVYSESCRAAIAPNSVVGVDMAVTCGKTEPAQKQASATAPRTMPPGASYLTKPADGDNNGVDQNGNAGPGGGGPGGVSDVGGLGGLGGLGGAGGLSASALAGIGTAALSAGMIAKSVLSQSNPASH